MSLDFRKLDPRRLVVYWDEFPVNEEDWDDELDDDIDYDEEFEDESEEIVQDESFEETSSDVEASEEFEDIDDDLDDDDYVETEPVLLVGYINNKNELDVIGQVLYTLESGFKINTDNIFADVILIEDREVAEDLDAAWDVLRHKVVDALRLGVQIGYIGVRKFIEYVSFAEVPGRNSITDARIAFPFRLFDDFEYRNYYVDTEFTGLYNGTELISVGIVSPSADMFYAESNEYDAESLNDWLKENVIENLLYNDVDSVVNETINEDGTRDIYMKGSKDEIREALVQWLEQTSLPGSMWQMVGDVCHYDKIMVDDLFGGSLNIPERMSKVWIDINDLIADTLQITPDEAFDISRHDFVKNCFALSEDTLNSHNALSDAIVIQAIHESLTI